MPTDRPAFHRQDHYLDIRCIDVQLIVTTSHRAPMSSLALLQGSLDLLILKTLSWGPAHGYAIARWIESLTGQTLQIGEGSLYPGLHRLAARDLIEAEWRVSNTGRRAKFYRLTTPGRRALQAEMATWRDFVAAVAKVLATASQPS